jgi:serine/threonine protein kinase
MSEILDVGKFQVLGTLGAGAHSSILHIRRSADGKQYALKVIPINTTEDRKYLEQARHELRVAQMLTHPNLIKVYCMDMTRDWLMRVKKAQLLIEYVNGKTLDQIPKLSLPRLVQIFEKISAGVDHMHRRNVYHADLKPNNVLLSRSGDVKVIDFGLAWIKGEPKDRVQGTPEYIAPEQAKQGTVNEQTDVYNLGATMYRLTTFRLPPSPLAQGGLEVNSKTFAMLLKPVNEFNPLVPPELCDLIHKCLSYKPTQRPQRMADVNEMLKEMSAKMVQKDEDKLEHLEF